MSILQFLSKNDTTKQVRGAHSDILPFVPVGGNYMEWARKGQIFVGSTTTAAIIPKFDDTTNVPTLWNPADSGKAIVPISLSVSYLAEGTEIIHSILLGYKTNAGSALGTAAPFSVFTEVAPVSLNIGSKVAAVGKWSPATNTATAAHTYLMTLGMGFWTEGTAATSSPYSAMEYEFKGRLLMQPGTSVIVCADAASSTTAYVSLVWAELPLEYL
ncbi:hypothetical protein M0Q28_06415 [Patescibacteria group bacterium]|jgi:hypothetical protein|nr:hypothetical protein [Patescibacteria group bacterium]